MTINNPNIPIDSGNSPGPVVVTSTMCTQIKLGLDVHLSFIMIVVQEGNLPLKAPRKITPDRLVTEIGRWRAQGCEVHCVQESCGFGFILHRRLQEAGAHSIVITPIRLNERNTPRKTDKLDARALCRRLSRYLDGDRDALRPIRIPTEEEQLCREISRRREFFQRQIRRLDNHGRALVCEYAFQPLKAGWWGPRKWKKLAPGLTPWLQERLSELRELILPLKKKLNALTEELEQRVHGQEIPLGLGALTLSVLDAEVCDWKRFHNRKQVGSFTGCCPGVHGSAGQERYGPIDRCGNRRVRVQLVEAVWRFLQWQPDWKARQKHLRRLGDSVAQRKKVVVALARQLSVDLWRWRTGQCSLQDLGLIAVKVF